MPRIKTTLGYAVTVTEAKAEKIRRLRRKYGPELFLSRYGDELVVAVFGRVLFRTTLHADSEPKKGGGL